MRPAADLPRYLTAAVMILDWRMRTEGIRFDTELPEPD